MADHDHTPTQGTPLTYADVSDDAKTVINEIAQQTTEGDGQPSPDLLNGLANVFAELEAENTRLRNVLGLPFQPHADAHALRTAFAIYVEQDEFEPTLKPGQSLPTGIIQRDWASYFQAHPHNEVLKNLPGITDNHQLTNLEFALSALRSLQLITGSTIDDQPANAATLNTIHHHLFQDVYEWAGKHRIVNIAKGDHAAFADPHTGEIIWFLNAVHHMGEIVPWETLDRPTFVSAMAGMTAYLHYAHPFRRGNGRTNRMLLRHLARRSPFRLQFARTTPDDWHAASFASAPSEAYPMPDPAPLLDVIDNITVGQSADLQPVNLLIFDMDAIWPELTAGLSEDQIFILNECLVDIWFEGWTPTPDIPHLLTGVLTGNLDIEKAIAQEIAKAGGQPQTPATDTA